MYVVPHAARTRGKFTQTLMLSGDSVKMYLNQGNRKSIINGPNLYGRSIFRVNVLRSRSRSNLNVRKAMFWEQSMREKALTCIELGREPVVVVLRIRPEGDEHRGTGRSEHFRRKRVSAESAQGALGFVLSWFTHLNTQQ